MLAQAINSTAITPPEHKQQRPRIADKNLLVRCEGYIVEFRIGFFVSWNQSRQRSLGLLKIHIRLQLRDPRKKGNVDIGSQAQWHQQLERVSQTKAIGNNANDGVNTIIERELSGPLQKRCPHSACARRIFEHHHTVPALRLFVVTKASACDRGDTQRWQQIG